MRITGHGGDEIDAYLGRTLLLAAGSYLEIPGGVKRNRALALTTSHLSRAILDGERPESR